MRRWLAPVVIALAAVAYAILVIWNQGTPSSPGNADLYGAHYQSVVYALQALRDGHGLLWNRLLNSGQAFLPATLVGLLYPPNAVFLVTSVDHGFLLSAIAHLTIGGLSTYLLARELTLRPPAAVCAGLAFMLGGSSLSITHWVPTNVAGPYAWMPAALWLVERLLRAPRLAAALALGVVLTLALLPGYPQIVFFTYQLIALRVAWQLVTAGLSGRSLACIGLGLVVPLGLGAAYLLPAAELARESVRGHGLSLADLQPFTRPTFARFRLDGGASVNTWLPIVTLTPAMVAAVSLGAPAHWRQTCFYLGVLLLYAALALWPPAFEVYSRLPLGNVFRDPHRFLWIMSFALAMLVGLGADALLGRVAPPPAAAGGRTRGAAVTVGLLLLGMLAAFAVSRRSLFAWEWACLAGLGLVAACAWRRPSGSRWVEWLAAACLIVTIGANLFLAGSAPFSRRLADTQRLFGAAAAFDAVRGLMSPLDRVYFFGDSRNVAFYDKAPSMMGVPAITDYEPQTQQRFADLIVWMLRGRGIERLNEFYFFRSHPLPKHWPLFDLLAARFIITHESDHVATLRAMPRLHERFARDGLVMLENPDALPRAFWVPRAEIEPDPRRLLTRLGRGPASAWRRTALLDEPPPDGFLGEPSATADAGAVLAFTDRSEEVRVRVGARQPGFLFLADQHYPGWEATVNGIPTPILRANYVFRLVRVPAGDSEVVFRYRPASWRWGWRISVTSLALVVAGLVWSGRRARRR